MDTETQHDDGNKDTDERDLENESVIFSFFFLRKRVNGET